MSDFPYHFYSYPSQQQNECFFSQLLRQCSMEEIEAPQKDDNQEKIEILQIDYSIKATDESKRYVEGDLWRRIEDDLGDATCSSEPHLSRESSLRKEQQRRIKTFIEIFGHRTLNPEQSEIKMFSPQKKKRINKQKK